MPVIARENQGSLISVIVPVYRAEKYLRRCLDSLIQQSHRELEIILVDDGSPDSSGEICDEYAERDERIVTIHTENRGAYAARNAALDAARGDYIAFVDADDRVDGQMFEKLLALLLETDADISQCEMKNDGLYAQIRSKKCGGPVVYERDELTEAFFGEFITHGLLGKLFRAHVWNELRFAEDFYHVDAMTMARMEGFCSRLARMDDELYLYNTTNPSITRGKRTALHIKSKERLFEIFSCAAIQRASAAGSFFICREIPSTGRLILPGGDIGWKMAVEHIRVMRKIYARHWGKAKQTDGYRTAPAMKKILWNLFRYAPLCASYLSWVRAYVIRHTF